MERDNPVLGNKNVKLDFNSHAHVERDCKDDTVRIAGENFNSHAHVERDEQMTPAINALSDFNSHAHVERDEKSQELATNFWISTHTLTWSVTRSILRLRHFMTISTHTLTWSVTIWNLRITT